MKKAEKVRQYDEKLKIQYLLTSYFILNIWYWNMEMWFWNKKKDYVILFFLQESNILEFCKSSNIIFFLWWGVVLFHTFGKIHTLL